MSVLKIKDSGGNWVSVPALKGVKGNKGDKGDQGVKGDTGAGLASGGTQGQILAKASGTDYDTEWIDNISDVTVGGTSVVSGGVAEIPKSASGVLGVVGMSPNWLGFNTNADGLLYLTIAPDSAFKNGTDGYRPVIIQNQHIATFYGLAKAAGCDEKYSTLSVGTYTEEAKVAIRNMIDATGESASVTVTGTDPVIQANRNTRYICGEVLSLDFTPCASGICDVIFTCGSSLTVLTLPQTVVLPEWFEVELNHTYEISIVDGVYGAVMVW